jgi:5-formyltetrahydrofolate cyclo-ligase
MHRWSHHLNLWVQDYFGSGSLGDFHLNRIELRIMTVISPDIAASSQISKSSSALRQMLRKNLRKRRQSINVIAQKTAARRLFHNIRQTVFFRKANHMAFYQATNGEIDPSLLLRHALRQGKHCFLPVLHPIQQNRMLFVRVRENTRLVPNRWGIAEPALRICDVIPAKQLDLVLVPLVGFDNKGNRLGMGKGFYDRCFVDRHQHRKSNPLLVGLAHDCQEVTEGITPTDWDIPMDALATPAGYLRTRRHW